MSNSTNYTLKDSTGKNRNLTRLDQNKYQTHDYKPPTTPINNHKEASHIKSRHGYETTDINRRSISPMRSPQRMSTSYKSPNRQMISPTKPGWASPGQKLSPRPSNSIQRRSVVHNSIYGTYDDNIPRRSSIDRSNYVTNDDNIPRRSSIDRSNYVTNDDNNQRRSSVHNNIYVTNDDNNQRRASIGNSNYGTNDDNILTEVIIEKPVYYEKVIEKPVDKIVYIDRPIEKVKYIDKPVEKIVYIDKFIEKPVYVSNEEETTKLLAENRQLSEKILYNQELHSQNQKLVGQTNKKINELIKEKNNLFTQNEEIKAKEDLLSDENTRLKSKETALINENNNLIVKLQHINDGSRNDTKGDNELYDLKNKNSELEDQLNKRDKEVKDLRNNNLTIQENLEFTNKSQKDKESILEELECRIKHFTNQLTTEKIELAKSVEKKDKEIERLTQDIGSSSSYKDLYDKVMKNNTRMENKIQELQQDQDQEVSKRNEQHESNVKLLDNIKGLEKIKDQWQTDRDVMTKEFSDEQRQIKYYATENSQMRLEKEKINKDNIKMADEIVRLSQMLKVLGENYSEVKDQFRRYKNRQSQERQSHDSKDFNSPKIKDNYILKEYEERIQTLQGDNGLLKDENEKLADYVRQLEKHLHEKDIEMEDFEKTVNDTTTKEIDLKNKLEKEFAVNEKLLKKYEFISQEYDKITDENNRMADDQDRKDKQIVNLQKKLQKYEDHMNKNKERIKLLEKAMDLNFNINDEGDA